MSDHHAARPHLARDGVRALCIAVAVVLLASSALPSAASAQASAGDVDGDGTVSVEVTDDSPQPTTTPPRSTAPPPSQQQGGSPTVSRSTTVTAQVTQATIPNPVAADTALGDDAVLIDGILAMSGLSASASPSLAIGNGHVTVDFVIRNLSSAPFDATADFWVDNLFGARIDAIDDVTVSGLQADETRRVQVRFDGLGQNVLLHVNAVFSPPATLDGVAVEPTRRNTSIFVPPWFSIALVTGIGGAGWWGWWYANRRRAVIALQPLAAGGL